MGVGRGRRRRVRGEHRLRVLTASLVGRHAVGTPGVGGALGVGCCSGHQDDCDREIVLGRLLEDTGEHLGDVLAARAIASGGAPHVQVLVVTRNFVRRENSLDFEA